MVLTDFSFLRGEYDDPALVPANSKKFNSSPMIRLSKNPADEFDWTTVARPTESRVKPLFPTPLPASAMISPTPLKSAASDLGTQPVRRSVNPRIKSYSDSGLALESMVPVIRKSRPYSTGDIDDLRRVGISGFSKNKSGTWMFTVDVGSENGLVSYAVRRRFSDFRELYDGLQEYVDPSQLPELPHHGLYSVVQLFFSPEPALSQRAKKLEELLQFVNKHPMLSTSRPFIKFLGKNPSSPDVGYVSLSCYEAPTSDSSFRLSSSRGRERRLST